MSIFFTSDCHFSHSNIIRYCNRPFKNVSEMDEALIKNWNDVVTFEDEVYILGDFAFYRDEKDYINTLSRLNGTKYLVYGNHDKKIRGNGTIQKMFKWCKDGTGFVNLKVDVSGDMIEFCLMHFAMRVWDRSHHGVIHLYGHSHGSLPDDPNAMSMDVGVDANNFKPVHLDDVLFKMYNKKFKPVDHHGK